MRYFVNFVDYWSAQSMKLTRSNLRAAEVQQAGRQIQTYTQALTDSPDNSDNASSFDNPGSSENEDTEGSEYCYRDSSSSIVGHQDESKQYLVHDGKSYQYKLKEDSVRWLVNEYDVSQAFFDYRDAVISKAEDLQALTDQEQLAFGGFMIIDNNFVNSDIVDFEQVQFTLDDIDRIDEFNSAPITNSQQELIFKFANDLAQRNINMNNTQNYIKQHENKHPEDTNVCRTLFDMTNIYSTDYSTDESNEATHVRNTIDTFFRSFFPNSQLTKSIGADAMIDASSKRFTRIDPSLKNHGKRADFSIVTNKSNHVLLTLEAKPNKNKRINELAKLSKEMKDSMKSIHSDGYPGVVLTGLLMKGNTCYVYCMGHIYDGLYRVVLVKKINFPGDSYEMHQLLPIFSVFQKLKAIVYESALKLRNRSLPATRIADDIVSMHTPIIVRVGKRKLDKNDPAIQHARRRLF